MDWRLALTVLAALPVFAALFHWLSLWLGPLAGQLAGMALYWAGLAALSLLALAPGDRTVLLAQARAPRWLAVTAFVPVVVMAWVALGALGESTMPAVLLLVVGVAALLNGTLEELFWRGALIPAPDREAVLVGWALFVAWHVTYGFVQGAEPWASAGLVLGAALMGAVWMALRLRTGSLTAGIAAHVAFNLFAFADLAARGWPAG